MKDKRTKAIEKEDSKKQLAKVTDEKLKKIWIDKNRDVINKLESSKISKITGESEVKYQNEKNNREIVSALNNEVDFFPNVKKLSSGQSAANIILNIIIKGDFDKFNLAKKEGIPKIVQAIVQEYKIDPKVFLQTCNARQQGLSKIDLSLIKSNTDIDKINHTKDVLAEIGSLKFDTKKKLLPKVNVLNLFGKIIDQKENIKPYVNEMNIQRYEDFVGKLIEAKKLDLSDIFIKALNKNNTNFLSKIGEKGKLSVAESILLIEKATVFFAQKENQINSKFEQEKFKFQEIINDGKLGKEELNNAKKRFEIIETNSKQAKESLKKSEQSIGKALVDNIESYKKGNELKSICQEVLESNNIKPENSVFLLYDEALNSKDISVKVNLINILVSKKNVPLASLIIEKVDNNDEKKVLLLEVAKYAINSGGNNPRIFEVLEKSMGSDKKLNAEIILEATKGLDFDDSRKKNVVEKFERLYNQKVRGGLEEDVTKEFNEIFNKINPHDLGKLLFRKTYKETKDLHSKSSLEGAQALKFEKAASLLQANLNKNDKDNAFPPLDDAAKNKAIENLTANLGLKQMSKIVAVVEGYESYSQKNWLSKFLSRFVDEVSRKFSEFKAPRVQKGLEVVMTKGAKVEKKVAPQILSITKDKGKGMNI